MTFINIKETNVQLTQCYRLYKEYQWLLDSYIVDFFVKDYWEKLLPSWRIFFENNDPEILVQLLSYNQKSTKIIFPLSILASKQLLRSITLNRNYVESSSKSCTDMFSNKSINKLFWKQVKQKKIHEISSFGNKCAELAQKTKVDIIIDCGSGMGHLARYLAYKHKLRVVCLETQEQLIARAKILDERLESCILRNDADILIDCTKPVHLHYTVQENAQFKDIMSLLLEHDIVGSKDRIALIGLHPCGNLAAVLLRIFTESNKIAFTCTVGCCYMKLTEMGHPLSDNGINLSYTARELACHAIEQLARKANKPNGLEILRTHAWRAALELLLVRSGRTSMEGDRIRLQSAQYRAGGTFVDYCERALRGTGMILQQEDLEQEYVASVLGQLNRVVVFSCLRTLFAPVLETIVLLDRALFACRAENAVVKLESIFQPIISPRNHLLSTYR